MKRMDRGPSRRERRKALKHIPHRHPRRVVATITVRPRPCPSCPYRRDVPSGIWEAAEYAKLAGYDGDVPTQFAAGAAALFHCHSQQERLCAGWVGCHDMANNLAVRLCAREVDPAVFEYVSPVPLFASGAEAAEHGMRDLSRPGPEARHKIGQLLRLLAMQAGDPQ